MSNLTRYLEAQITEIVSDAIDVTPVRHQADLMQAFGYLAYCYVSERDEAHLADIQALINAAKADNAIALTQMQSQLNTEIRQLRGDMLQGFEKVAQCLTRLGSQHSALESRVSQLEKPRPLEPMIVYVEEHYHVDNSTHIDNSDHSTHVRKGSGKMSVPAELMVLLALTCIIALLCLQQSITVRDSWFLWREQQEVNR